MTGDHVLCDPKEEYRDPREVRRDPVTVAPGQSSLSQGLEMDSWGASDCRGVPRLGFMLV